MEGTLRCIWESERHQTGTILKKRKKGGGFALLDKQDQENKDGVKLEQGKKKWTSAPRVPRRSSSMETPRQEGCEENPRPE